jgi:transposase
MAEVIRIGIDTSKHVFQVHGVDAKERAVLRRTLRRGQMERFFAALAPTVIGLEACGAPTIGRGHCRALDMRCDCCRRNMSDRT